MNSESSSLSNPSDSRREFLKKSGTSAAGAAALSQLIVPTSVFGAPTDKKLKLGVVGCGGRGTGAVHQALSADSNIELTAIGDAFPEKIERSIAVLKTKLEPQKLAVKKSHIFTGLDAYRKVLDSGVDVVVLATPPGFRPGHLMAAIEAGKHVFAEKPMATDGPGVRLAMKAVELSKQKGLGLLAGFCWRYHYARRELFKRIAEGAIGDVRSAYGTYLTGPVKPMPEANKRPAGISDLEWMVRNWSSFTGLAGDGLVEQAIHTVDWLMWLMNDQPPTHCVAVGGRQIPAHGGNIFDHVEVNYEWENGVRGFVGQRQISGCHNENNLYVQGADGEGLIRSGRSLITGKNPWRFRGKSNNMYQTEHDEFFASIREGHPLNDGDRMMKSTLAGIMGRMAGYTGQRVSWEQALNSKQLLAPQDLTDWSAEVSVEPMAQPGRTKLF